MSLDPFGRAHERLKPLLQTHGFRLDAVERTDRAAGSAVAEYFRSELRVRLIWDAREGALCLESARQVGAQVVSRWVDVEWALAGERLPVDLDTSDERIERLAASLDRFLRQGRSKPRTR